jgi:hypothetical protein
LTFGVAGRAGGIHKATTSSKQKEFYKKEKFMEAAC